MPDTYLRVKLNQQRIDCTLGEGHLYKRNEKLELISSFNTLLRKFKTCFVYDLVS